MLLCICECKSCYKVENLLDRHIFTFIFVEWNLKQFQRLFLQQNCIDTNEMLITKNVGFFLSGMNLYRCLCIGWNILWDFNHSKYHQLNGFSKTTNTIINSRKPWTHCQQAFHFKQKQKVRMCAHQLHIIVDSRHMSLFYYKY